MGGQVRLLYSNSFFRDVWTRFGVKTFLKHFGHDKMESAILGCYEHMAQDPNCAEMRKRGFLPVDSKTKQYVDRLVKHQEPVIRGLLTDGITIQEAQKMQVVHRRLGVDNTLYDELKKGVMDTADSRGCLVSYAFRHIINAICLMEQLRPIIIKQDDVSDDKGERSRASKSKETEQIDELSLKPTESRQNEIMRQSNDCDCSSLLKDVVSTNAMGHQHSK